MKNVKHIFFDLDRTLWDFEANSRKVIADLYHEYNLENRCNACFEEFITLYERINLHLWEQLRCGNITKQQLRSSRFHNCMQQLGYNDYETAYALEEEYVKRSPYQKTLVPHTLEVLEHFKPKYSLHIITNGFKEVQHIKLQQSGLKNYFEQIIISEEAGAAKPSKEIFLKAMQAAGCAPHESVMIGDDLEADIKGAVSAGMKAILFDPSNTAAAEESYLKIASLNELTSIL